MVSSTKKFAAIAGVLALLLVAPAGAQTRGEPRPAITGEWRFDTAPYNVNPDGSACRMSGLMTIKRNANGAYSGRFTARETCPHGSWTAEQTCIGVRKGDKLELTATIIKLTPANVSYAPDNWSLTIKNGSRMVGQLRSADVADVEFRRSEAVVS
jgi:hypothetical protein